MAEATPRSASNTSWPPIHSSVKDKLDPAFVTLYNNDVIPNAPAPSQDIHIIRKNFRLLFRGSAPDGQEPKYNMQGRAPQIKAYATDWVPEWEGYPGSSPEILEKEHRCGDIEIKVFKPYLARDDHLPTPVHFTFHSGAFVAGDVLTDYHSDYTICAGAECTVINIGYRLAHDTPFGVGIMDALRAVQWILAYHDAYSIQPDNFTLGGVNAGGTIALLLAHLLRDADTPGLKGVVVGTPLISDVRKLTHPEMSPYPSMSDFQHAPMLDWQRMKLLDVFKSTKTNPSRDLNRCLPWFLDLMKAPNLKNVAPLTFIGTAEIDPRCDEAEEYANYLRSEGNDVRLKRYPGVPHQFMYFPERLQQARDYLRDVTECVKECQARKNDVSHASMQQAGQRKAAQSVGNPVLMSNHHQVDNPDAMVLDTGLVLPS
ncbi:AB hydrolase superfamily protein [Cyphellophora attinorum]|uniref:AB hydrolase superfamily protein n=1 Tax=Cyphellophora attinorum TaxID=1664694 RepID=A0A0N0NJB7_9EURO|nr:AB hydrolase superfamily protein [Phialophora attinorum]KPI36728.1 AB hydrolase superfamily protein [Phialophora attinorum]